MTFTLPGVPRAWSRPKRGKLGRAATVGYGSKAATAHLRDLVLAAKAEMGIERAVHHRRFPLSGPVVVSVGFFFGENPHTTITVDEARLGGKTTRPDLTNLLKLIDESLQHAGVIADDAQVVQIAAAKRENPKR